MTRGTAAGGAASRAGRAASRTSLCVLLLWSLPVFGETIVLLPLSRLSSSADSVSVVAPLFEKRLVERGWSIAPADMVEAFLEEKRIRYLESLPAPSREEILDHFAADAILHGSILEYRGDRSPVVALTGRMTDRSGQLIWGDVAILTTGGAEGVLGIGRTEDPARLAQRVVEDLFRNLPRAGREGLVDPGRGGIFGGPRTYRSSQHPRGEVRRVCIIPFTARDALAARVVNELLSIRLAASDEFEVVEPAEFRAAMRREKIRSVAEMTSEELSRVGSHLGTSLFLRGNVHVYREGPTGRSEVQLDLNLADVTTGAVLWAVTHHRRGTEYSGLLQRGMIDSPIELTDRMLSETIRAHASATLRKN